MKYLILLKTHSEYEEEKDTLATPNVVYDYEHVHLNKVKTTDSFILGTSKLGIDKL